MTYTVIQGDCRDTLRRLDRDTMDAIVCDPPYHLTQNSRKGSLRTNDPNTPFGRHRLATKGFMGSEWDGGNLAFQPELWAEVLRVAKPGAHLAAFGGTRTFHRMACAIEDAGWELRDCLSWLYGTGFPKSLDVSKALDKQAGAQRDKVLATGGLTKNRNLNDDGWSKIGAMNPLMDSTIPVTDAAKQWNGWGTALKPAWEPVLLARKPFEGTVADNVFQYGTGALNISACRIGQDLLSAQKAGQARLGAFERTDMVTPERVGRWPANVALDENAAQILDAQSGQSHSRVGKPRASKHSGAGWGMRATGAEYDDAGGASRFFYVAKATRSEREAGCETNNHPTVKPIALMRWLVRLLTPPGGLVLDPFTGSGSTGCAAVMEGCRFFGCELSDEYCKIARARIAHWATT